MSTVTSILSLTSIDIQYIIVSGTLEHVFELKVYIDCISFFFDILNPEIYTSLLEAISRVKTIHVTKTKQHLHISSR